MPEAGYKSYRRARVSMLGARAHRNAYARTKRGEWRSSRVEV